MSGLVEGVLGLAFSVAGLTVVFAAVLVVWWTARPGQGPRRCLTALGLFLFATSVPALPLALITAYTSRYHPFVRADLPDAKVVVLLGAGTVAIPGREDQFITLNAVSAARALEAARVYRLLDRPLIVSSGGTRSKDTTTSSAWVMRSTLVALGVPAERVRLEDRSFTTEDEAVLIAPILHEWGSKSFVLVTSASHMPRSEAVFRAQGTVPIPAAAVDYPRQPMDLRPWLLPSVEGWQLSRALAHEWFGFAYYRFRGWTG